MNKIRPSAVGVSFAIVAALVFSACGSARSAAPTTTSTTSNVVVLSKWSLDHSDNSGSLHNALMAVTYAGSRAWAVGDFYNGTSDQTLIERRSHSQWQVVSSPNASAKHNELDAVSGTTGSDVWAVGRYQPPQGQERTLIEHYNGTKWSIVPSPNVGSFHNELDGVVAIDAFDAWAVGHYDVQATPTDKALIEHWDGTSWKIVPAPKFLLPVSDLVSITATPKGGPIWAVGSQQIGTRSISLVCQYLDGIWRVVPSPNHGPYSNELSGVASVSLRDMWAVGSTFHGATSTAVTMHWDGRDIDLERVPRRLTHHYVLAAVAADPGRRIFAVGNYFSGRADVAAVLQWINKHWVVISVANQGALHNALLGVVAVRNEPPLAVGKYFGGSADRTLIERCSC